jgi:ANTAR domain
MEGGRQREALTAVGIGSLEDASAAVARLLSVTEATMGRRAQLEGALQSRIAIEQAKGILAERHGLNVEDAFAVLRRAARTNRMKLQDLVGQVRAGEPDPPAVVEQVERWRRRA